MIRRISPLQSGRLELADELCPGLVLRITEQGSKSFSVIYHVAGEGGVSASGRLLAGVQHRVTLGRYPIVDLGRAREQARGIPISASEGKDPRCERRGAVLQRRSNSVEAVTGRF